MPAWLSAAMAPSATMATEAALAGTGENYQETTILINAPGVAITVFEVLHTLPTSPYSQV
jgi:hypothetical protein